MFVTNEQLQEAFGYKTTSKLKETLAANNVRFFVDRDARPFTTTEALNAALGAQAAQDDSGLDIDWMED